MHNYFIKSNCNFIGLYPIGEFILQSNNEPPFLQLKTAINWPNGNVPMDAPICGFNGEFCLQNYTTKDIVMGLFGGVTFAMSVVVILVYRNYKYEQELDSLLWKIESSELQVNIFFFIDKIINMLSFLIQIYKCNRRMNALPQYKMEDPVRYP